jgi:hypothetical protein
MERQLADVRAKIEKFSSVDRGLHKIIVMENITSQYSGDAVAQFPKDGISKPSPTGKKRGFVITTQFRTTVPDNIYIQRFIEKCRALAEKKYPSLWIYGGHMTDKSVQGPAVAAATAKDAPADPAAKARADGDGKDPGLIDPVTGEDRTGDVRVVVLWVVLVENDGIKYPDASKDEKSAKR